LAAILGGNDKKPLKPRKDRFKLLTVPLVSQAVDFHLQYHQANSKKKYHQDM
jgi:hypothetical protein